MKLIVPLVSDKNPKAGSFFDEMTPLHFAAQFGQLDVVKYLADLVPDVNVKDSKDKSPLDYAKENDHAEVVEFLESFQ